MMRWKVILEYDGRHYAGWQRQKDAQGIQQLVEEALYKFCQQEITIYVAGRTDAGVHAAGQVVHFDLEYGDRTLDPFTLTSALNAHLRPHPVAVLAAEPVSHDFHARFGAINKLYTYRILCRAAPPVFEVGRIWHIKNALHIEAMREAAKHFLGTHDFTSFRDSQCQAKNPVKTLTRFDIEVLPYDEHDGVELRLHLEARSFLHHQVRNMTGLLVEIGKGKRDSGCVAEILAAKDRRLSGQNAPACGLSLMRVDYDEN